MKKILKLLTVICCVALVLTLASCGLFIPQQTTTTTTTTAPPPHECESICSECGKCEDWTCEENACESKCMHSFLVTGVEVNLDNVSNYDEETNTVEFNVGDSFEISIKGENIGVAFAKLSLVIEYDNGKKDYYVFTPDSFGDYNSVSKTYYYKDLYLLEKYRGGKICKIGYSTNFVDVIESTEFNVVLEDITSVPPTIDNVELISDNATFEGNTFTFVISPAEYVSVFDLRLTGTNLAKMLLDESDDYRLKIGDRYEVIINGSYEMINSSTVFGDQAAGVDISLAGEEPSRVYYSNDGGNTWIELDYYVVVLIEE